MNIKNINSLKELHSQLKGELHSYLLLYKEKTETPDCAFSNLRKVEISDDTIQVFAADVNTVRDIHPEYGIKSVPALMYFKGDKFVTSIKGCNTKDYYKSLFEKTLFSARIEKEGKPKLNITMYSTPTCTYCTQLKNYFRENNVSFRDVDVSKNQQAAEEMVKRSGQQGVPQTVINGTVIIGFDKLKIDKMIGLG